MSAAARPATGWRRRAGRASAPRFRAGRADGSTSRSSAGARRRRVQGTTAFAFPTSALPPQGGLILLAVRRRVKAARGSAGDQGADCPRRPIGNGDAVVVRVGDIEAVRTGTDAPRLAECG